MSDWDFVIIGSGFGGSVSALRLARKGYKVIVLEKGRRWAPRDFPKTNWDVKRWLWRPEVGWRGFFKMTFLRHVTVLSGVGVGGGSLVYANTLPVPKADFFAQGSWQGLADWKRELEPHYETALRMLGAARNPKLGPADEVMREIATDLGRADSFESTNVAVYFGKPGVTSPDPYFDGEGPDRTGCTHCGACMVGCRVGAKNTLDRNYLHLAEKAGATIQADTEVCWVRPRPSGGYELDVLEGPSFLGRRKHRYSARNVVFAGGVMGTVPLLLKLKASANGLPALSERIGDFVRTNSESLLGIVSSRRGIDLSKGVAISSIIHTDEHSHLEPVRYPEGSGFFRLLAAPHAIAPTVLGRLAKAAAVFARHPLKFLKAYFVSDWAKSTLILLYMRTLEGHLSLRLGLGGRLKTMVKDGVAPTANMPEATDLARRAAEKIDGFPQSIFTDLVLGTPTTAHILGGATIGKDPAHGVIDERHRVYGYDGLWVCDGSAISANPGVNPSLTITAMTERAMSLVPAKGEAGAPA